MSDLLKEYTEHITEDYAGAEILGKKVKVKNVDGGIYVYDVDDILSDYKREYILLCIIMDGDERGTVETYDGKFYKKSEKLYFIDTTQPDPSRAKADPMELFKKTYIPSTINIPSIWVDTPQTNDPPFTWTTTTTISYDSEYTGGATGNTTNSGNEWVTMNVAELSSGPNKNNVVFAATNQLKENLGELIGRALMYGSPR